MFNVSWKCLNLRLAGLENFVLYPLGTHCDCPSSNILYDYFLGLPMPTDKWKQNDNHQERIPPTTMKACRTTSNTAHQVSNAPAPSGMLSEADIKLNWPFTFLEPLQCSGRTSGGRLAQLASLEKAIHPDLYPDPKQPSSKGAIANLPDSVLVNPIVPVKKAPCTWKVFFPLFIMFGLAIHYEDRNLHLKLLLLHQVPPVQIMVWHLLLRSQAHNLGSHLEWTPRLQHQ